MNILPNGVLGEMLPYPIVEQTMNEKKNEW